MSQVVAADELPDCNAQDGADKKVECLQNSILGQLTPEEMQAVGVCYGSQGRELAAKN
jgi:hypothetical protein